MKGKYGLLFALLLVSQGVSQDQNQAGAAADLSRRIAAVTGTREAASLAMRNISTLAAADFAVLQRTLADGLRSRGLRLQESPAPVEIRATVSEDVSHFLLIAEIHKGEEHLVLMSGFPRAENSAARLPAIVMERVPLWEQDDPVLDIAPLPDGSLLSLDSARLSIHARQEGQWRVRESAPFAGGRPWPRDLRGRLAMNGASYQAWLPGFSCTGVAQPALTAECRAADEPWPVAAGLRAAFVPGRNYFAGGLVRASGARRSVAPFFTAAAAAGGWVLAGVDGRAVIYDGAFEPVGARSDWGSDVAGIAAACGAGTLVLATRAAEEGSSDAVQAYTVEGGAAVAASAPVEFRGPVTALWSEGAEAVAVARDPATGKYVAYRLSAVCGS